MFSNPNQSVMLGFCDSGIPVQVLCIPPGRCCCLHRHSPKEEAPTVVWNKSELKFKSQVTAQGPQGEVRMVLLSSCASVTEEFMDSLGREGLCWLALPKEWEEGMQRAGCGARTGFSLLSLSLPGCRRGEAAPVRC